MLQPINFSGPGAFSPPACSISLWRQFCLLQRIRKPFTALAWEHCPSSCFVPSCSVVCSPFSLLEGDVSEGSHHTVDVCYVCLHDSLPLLAFYYQVSTLLLLLPVHFVRISRPSSQNLSPPECSLRRSTAKARLENVIGEIIS